LHIKGFGAEAQHYRKNLCGNKRWNCVIYINMEDFGEPLLHYHENCPGCKVDQAKELKMDVTFRNVFSIWIVVLCSCKLKQSFFNL
jgi:hypothetical protein